MAVFHGTLLCPVVCRPVIAAALMLAVSQGRVPVNEQLEVAVEKTGLRDVYEALNFNTG
jgi:hypothetical protein